MTAQIAKPLNTKHTCCYVANNPEDQPWLSRLNLL